MTRRSEKMRTQQRLSTKFISIGLGWLVLALLSIGLTMVITRQLDGGAAAVNEIGRLRMQAWRLVHAKVSDSAAADVANMVGELDSTLKRLREADQERASLVPWDDATRIRFAELEASWRSMRPAWQGTGSAADMKALIVDVDALVSKVDVLVRSIEARLARLTAVLNLFQVIMMALAVAAAVFILYIGHLFVIQPLQRMRLGLQQVEAGDFSARVTAESADEFGELAAGFNHMASTLQGLYDGLELKVAEKTQDLESKRARLAALYEVSSFLVGEHTLEELAQGFARKIGRISGADAVAVRWYDEGSERYLMLASDCLPEELVHAEHCLKSGECACGQTQASARTRVIPIVSESEQRLGNCARAGYDSLVSVPIKLQHRVLGEVDLFFRQETTLSTEDRDLYDALAGHLANAIESLRTEALVRESAVSHERTLLARELHDSIAQSLSFLKIQVSLLRGAVNKKDEAQIGRVLDEIDTGVRESTHDVRELLVHFRTRTDSDDIEQALRTTVRKFEHQSGMKARFSMHGHGVALHSDVQLQVLHVVQEALSNVRKHARATQVEVDVYRGPQWVFRVRDNGQGFDSVNGAGDETQVGLQIMRERAQRIGARVEVTSQPGQGTEVRMALNA